MIIVIFMKMGDLLRIPILLQNSRSPHARPPDHCGLPTFGTSISKAYPVFSDLPFAEIHLSTDWWKPCSILWCCGAHGPVAARFAFRHRRPEACRLM